jgi:hypothetical protein
MGAFHFLTLLFRVTLFPKKLVEQWPSSEPAQRWSPGFLTPPPAEPAEPRALGAGLLPPSLARLLKTSRPSPTAMWDFCTNILKSRVNGSSLSKGL